MQLSNIVTFCAKMIVGLESGLAVRNRLCVEAASELRQNQGDWDALVAAQPQLSASFKTLQRYLRMDGKTGGETNSEKARGAAWAVFQETVVTVDEFSLRGALLTVTCDWIGPITYTPLPHHQAKAFATWDPELQQELRGHAEIIKKDRITAFKADHIDWSPGLLLAALQEWLIRVLSEFPTDRPLEELPSPRNWNTKQQKCLSQLHEIFAWLSQAPAAYTNNLVANAPRARLTGSFTERLKVTTHFVNEAMGTEFHWVVNYHESKQGSRVGTYALASSLPQDHPRSRYRDILPCPKLRGYLEALAGVDDALFFMDEGKGRHYLGAVLLVLLPKLATDSVRKLSEADSLVCLAILELLAAPKPVVVQSLIWMQLLNQLQAPALALKVVIDRLNDVWKTSYLLRAEGSGGLLERQNELPEIVRRRFVDSGLVVPDKREATPDADVLYDPELFLLLSDMNDQLKQGCTFAAFGEAFKSKILQKFLVLTVVAAERPDLAEPIATIQGLVCGRLEPVAGRKKVLESVQAATTLLIAALPSTEAERNVPIESPFPFSEGMRGALHALEERASVGRHSGTLQTDARLLRRCVTLWMGEHRSFPEDFRESRSVVLGYLEIFTWLAQEPMITSRAIFDALRDRRKHFDPWNTETLQSIVDRVNRETESDFLVDYVYETHPDDPEQYGEGHCIRRQGWEEPSAEARLRLVADKLERSRVRRAELPPPPVTPDLSLVGAFEKAVVSPQAREQLIAASQREINLLMSNAQEFRAGMAQALASLTPFGRELAEPERTKRLALWACVIEIFSNADLPLSEFWKADLHAHGFSAPQYRAILTVLEARWGAHYEISSKSSIKIRRTTPVSPTFSEVWQADQAKPSIQEDDPKVELRKVLQDLQQKLASGTERKTLIQTVVPGLKPHIKLLHELKLRDAALIPDIDRLIYFTSLEVNPDATYSLQRTQRATAALLQSGLLGEEESAAKPITRWALSDPLRQEMEATLAILLAQTSNGFSRTATLDDSGTVQRACMARWLAWEMNAAVDFDAARLPLIQEALVWVSGLPQPDAKLMQTTWLRCLGPDQPVKKIRDLLTWVNNCARTEFNLVYESQGVAIRTQVRHVDPDPPITEPKTTRKTIKIQANRESIAADKRSLRERARLAGEQLKADHLAKKTAAAAQKVAQEAAAQIAKQKARDRIKEEERLAAERLRADQRAKKKAALEATRIAQQEEQESLEREKRKEAERAVAPPSPGLLAKSINGDFQVGDRVRREDGFLAGTIKEETVISIGTYSLAAFLIVYQQDQGTRTEKILKTQMSPLGYKKV